MSEIEVSRIDEGSFMVTVREGSSSTTHTVRASEAEIERYGGGAPAERLIEASFQFLLAREPRESILRSFDLPVIERYFGDSPMVIRGML